MKSPRALANGSQRGGLSDITVLYGFQFRVGIPVSLQAFKFSVLNVKLHVLSSLPLLTVTCFPSLRRLHRVFDRARFHARAARFVSLRMLK